MNKPTIGTLIAGAMALTMAACGGSERPSADLAEALEGPGDPYADQTAYGFDDFDNDGDSELDANELHEWVEGPTFAFYMQREIFEDPNAPQRLGPLDSEVLIDGLFHAWDKNRNGGLERTEWDAAAHVVETFSDTTVAWIEFDTDGSELVDLAEVHTRLDRTEVLKSIDADKNGQIADEEMNQWFFALFDVDENGSVDRNEWRLAELYLNVPLL